MDPASLFSSANMTLQVFLIDLLLSGDNAVVIALACRRLPLAQRRMAMLMGAGAGVSLRVALTLLVNVVMGIPALKLLGAIALIIIAINLIVDEDDQGGEASEAEQSANLTSAMLTIVVADLAMSVDNVLALAAVAQGSVILLVVGLLLSVPLLMYGSVLLGRLLSRYPWLVTAGGALLGWIAGDIAMSDPLIADWINTQSPALTVFVPWLTAVFVILQSQNLASNIQTREHTAGLATPAAAELQQTVVMKTRIAAAVAINSPATTMPAPAPTFRASTIVETLQTKSLPAIAADLHDLTAPESELLSGPFKSRRVLALIMMTVIALTAWVLVASLPDDDAVSSKQSNTWSILPQPKPPSKFACPYFGTSLQYLHGSEKLTITVSGTTIKGVLNDGLIHWASPDNAGLPPDFSLPSRVLSDTDRSITIAGNQLGAIVCKKNG